MISDKLRFGHKLAEFQAFGIAKGSSQQTGTKPPGGGQNPAGQRSYADHLQEVGF